MPPDEKSRRYVRVQVPKGALVAWEHAGRRQVSKASVLAVGGLFISTPEPPPSGEFIKLVLDVPGGEVRARALVCYSEQGKGMGIEFKSMKEDARARLNRLLKVLTRI